MKLILADGTHHEIADVLEAVMDYWQKTCAAGSDPADIQDESR